MIVSDIAVTVSNLGKRYAIGRRQEPYGTLRDALSEAARGLFTRRRSGADDEGTLWALRHVTFDVRVGEAVGIVGRNGAGKSTLLKVLSRITRPTEGQAAILGRVGSLLEVGTGFHPELSGRENIFLNGAILGMSVADIRRRFDAIVDFAEIERFLDTPVKHYSSGMYTRLAFSVAAHLEPDVLVVDEVLAVGDMTFQKKCLGLMEGVSRQGRTVLFVSHNIPSLLSLCSRGVLLEGGQVTMVSDIRTVTDRYLSAGTLLSGDVRLDDVPRPRYGDELRLRRVRILDAAGCATPIVDLAAGFDLEIEYEILRPIRNCQVAFSLWSRGGHCVFQSTDLDEDPSRVEVTRPPGRYRVTCRVSATFLRAGGYSLDVAASVPGVRMLDECRPAIAFDVVDTGSVESRLAQGRLGVIAPVLRWSTDVIALAPTPAAGGDRR